MQICCAGEVMVEMAARGTHGRYQRGVAGDTYNTAVYLARAGLPVSYLTRLGSDPLSDDILDRLSRERIGTELISRVPGRRPGLYLIDNDPDGERRFSYWRGEAPARELFDRPLEIPGVDVFYFTGITLAITRGGLPNLLDLLEKLHEAGCQVVFDPNYRPALWDNPEQAREHVRAVLPLCDIALPTLDDETSLWGVAGVDDCRALYIDQGVRELVIKGASLTAHVFAGEERVTQQAEAVAALDTTGAGDAFNAGYLAARLAGADIATALDRAQQLATEVVQHHGAILPAEQGSH